jgi:hypothetical protein
MRHLVYNIPSPVKRDMLTHMIKRGMIPVVFALLLTGCSSEQPAPAPAKKAETKPPADETRRFPADGRESVEPVAAPLFGKDFLPGGNIAVYRKGAKSWKQFVIKNETAGQTAVLLGKFKDAMKNPKFIAHMGGYFGALDGAEFFVFPKGVWLAGTVGLPEKEADLAGRVMALRLD